jgi:hypothetical protein
MFAFFIALNCLKETDHQWLIPTTLATQETDQKGHDSKPARRDSSPDPHPKITTAKWTGGAPQIVEGLLCKFKALSLNLIP